MQTYFINSSSFRLWAFNFNPFSNRVMARKASISRSTDAFEYMLFEGDPDHLKPVVCNPNQITPWIDSDALKLSHRIGRGPFGDVWLATHHHRTEDYDRYHEVAVKMIYPVREDEMPAFLAKFDEIFSMCQGLENVCFLHGVSIYNGRVSSFFCLRLLDSYTPILQVRGFMINYIITVHMPLWVFRYA